MTEPEICDGSTLTRHKWWLSLPEALAATDASYRTLWEQDDVLSRSKLITLSSEHSERKIIQQHQEMRVYYSQSARKLRSSQRHGKTHRDPRRGRGALSISWRPKPSNPSIDLRLTRSYQRDDCRRHCKGSGAQLLQLLQQETAKVTSKVGTRAAIDRSG